MSAAEGRIFLNYRRDDAAGHAGRLYDALAAKFGHDAVFMDVDRLDPGVDFVEGLEQAINACDVFVAVIGRQWLSAADSQGRRRLDNPHDFVRLEIEGALNRGVRVIPVLVQEAEMPVVEEVPESLARLTRRQALEVSDSRFRYDVDRLLTAVEKVRNQLAAREQAERERARQAEEAERAAREQAERERARQAEEAERAAREQAERERARQAAQAAREEAEREHARQAEEAERAAREQAKRQRAQEAERTQREQAERARPPAAHRRTRRRPLRRSGPLLAVMTAAAIGVVVVALALAGAFSGGGPGEAKRAATASGRPSTATAEMRNGRPTLTYLAAPGVSNRVKISVPSSHREATIQDSAGVTPGVGCKAGRTPTTARCTFEKKRLASAEIELGDGDDTLDYSVSGQAAKPVLSLVRDGPGNDVVKTNAPAATLINGPGNDVFRSSLDRFSVVAGNVPGVGRVSGSGNDTIYGSRQKDSLVGGIGNDRIYGNAGNDVINGGPGRDQLEGGPGNDKLLGYGQKDKISGGPGADQIFGGGGIDSESGGGGNDVLDGASRQVSFS